MIARQFSTHIVRYGTLGHEKPCHDANARIDWRNRVKLIPSRKLAKQHQSNHTRDSFGVHERPVGITAQFISISFECYSVYYVISKFITRKEILWLVRVFVRSNMLNGRR